MAEQDGTTELTVRQRLEKAGFKSLGERSTWLAEHGDEILAFARTHTQEVTRKEFHIGLTTLARLRKESPLVEETRGGIEKRDTGPKPRKVVRTSIAVMGFSSLKERHAWLEQHGEEIAQHARQHGYGTAQKHFHIGGNRLAALMQKYPPRETPKPLSSVSNGEGKTASLLGEIDALFKLLGEQILIRMELVLTTLEVERTESARLQSIVNEQHGLIARLQALHNEALAKSKVGRIIPFGEFQKAFGRNQLGQRVSRRRE